MTGRRVAILPDNDGPGRKHAEQVAASLVGIAESVKVVTLPDLPDKGDPSDWLAAGGTIEELTRLVEAAPEYEHRSGQPMLSDGKSGGDSGLQPSDDSDAALAAAQSAGPYRETELGLTYMKPTRDGDVPVPLTNYTARIVGETVIDDGAEGVRQLAPAVPAGRAQNILRDVQVGVVVQRDQVRFDLAALA